MQLHRRAAVVTVSSLITIACLLGLPAVVHADERRVTIELEDGGRVEGRLAGYQVGTWRVRIAGTVVEIPEDAVRRVRFGAAPPPASEAEARPIHEGAVLLFDEALGFAWIDLGSDAGLKTDQRFAFASRRGGETRVQGLARVVTVGDEMSQLQLVESSSAGSIEKGDRIRLYPAPADAERRALVRRHVETGKRLFEELRYPEAAASLEKALLLDPEDAAARSFLDRVRVILGSPLPRIGESDLTERDDEREDIEELRRRLARAEGALEKLRDRGVEVDPLLAPKKPPVIDGVVVAVKEIDGLAPLVLLSVGRDDGVEVGLEFTVFRADTFIGKVVVEKVMPDMAGCRVVFAKEGDAVRASDRVSTRLP